MEPPSSLKLNNSHPNAISKQPSPPQTTQPRTKASKISTPDTTEPNPNPIPLPLPLPHFPLAPHHPIFPRHLSTLFPMADPELAASAQGALVVGTNARDAVARGEKSGRILVVGCGRLLEE